MLLCGQGNTLSTACRGGKFWAQGGVEGVSDDLLAENLCVAGFKPPSDAQAYRGVPLHGAPWPGQRPQYRLLWQGIPGYGGC